MTNNLERMKEVFKELDLRNQIDSVKGKWYYEDYKDNLRINKKSVVFSKYFKFEVVYHKADYEIAKEDYDTTFEGVTYHIKKGEDLSTSDFLMLKFDDRTIMYIDDFEKYSDRSKDILETIMVHIANYI